MSKNEKKGGKAGGEVGKGGSAGGKKGDPKAGKDGEKKEEEEESEPEPGFCDKLASCIITVCKFIYMVLVCVVNSIKDCIAFFWYPIKERCCICIDRIDKKLNPYKDESYTNV